MSQENRVALVTGANKGIGLETARQLGRLGVAVILGARDRNKGETAATTLRGEGIDARALKLDVTKAQDRDAAVQYIEKNFGRLDILVNNAGIAIEGGWGGNKTSSTTLPTLLQTFETNLLLRSR